MAFYILASGRNGTLYVGSTDDIERRVGEHKEKLRGGFTARYGVDRLVWFEMRASREAAFERERRIKKWNRDWKLSLSNGPTRPGATCSTIGSANRPTK